MNETTTEYLVKERESRKQLMEVLQSQGRWDEAAVWHETHIAPLNDELLERGVW